MPLEFHWDEEGNPRAHSARSARSVPSSPSTPSADRAGASSGADAEAGELLARFLESDVQGNLQHARELLHTIDRVEAGRLAAWSETGNAHTLKLSPAGAVLESLYDEAAPDQRLPLAELRRAVAGWQEFLAGGQRR